MQQVCHIHAYTCTHLAALRFPGNTRNTGRQRRTSVVHANTDDTTSLSSPALSQLSSLHQWTITHTLACRTTSHRLGVTDTQSTHKHHSPSVPTTTTAHPPTHPSHSSLPVTHEANTRSPHALTVKVWTTPSHAGPEVDLAPHTRSNTAMKLAVVRSLWAQAHTVLPAQALAGSPRQSSCSVTLRRLPTRLRCLASRTTHLSARTHPSHRTKSLQCGSFAPLRGSWTRAPSTSCARSWALCRRLWVCGSRTSTKCPM
jgi:hypothetical protein